MTSEDAPPAAEMPAAPGGRMWHTMAYIPDLDQVLLFGGGRFADTWLYADGSVRWGALSVRRVPTIERVGGLRGAYDTAAKRLIVPVYEGEGVPLETWSFDPQSGTWENLNPANPPMGRRFADLVYDAKANKSVLFGGVLKEDYSRISAETWVFDYTARSWTQMEPEQGPPAAYYHMVAYDADPGRVLVWGGEPKSEERVIWSYDTIANRWSKIAYTDGPQPNYDGVMTYAAELDRVFLYVRTQFWSYDDNTNQWSHLDPSPAPGMRLAAGMAYDEDRHHLILYGGTTPDSGVYAYGMHDGKWDIALE
jgi:hypothetical protein